MRNGDRRRTWCAARSAACRDDDFLIADRTSRGSDKIESAETSLAARAARPAIPALLRRSDGFRACSRNLGQRKNQGLSALVLGRPTGAAGKQPLPDRWWPLRVHLSAAVGG